MTITRRVAQRAHRSFNHDLTTGQRTELCAYAAFTTTVAAVRGVTRLVRAGRGPFRNISIGSTHIHHYVPGIALIAVSGAVGLRGVDSENAHCVLGAVYGSGCALVADELPLLLDLRDNYWSPEGAWRVQLTLSLSAIFGAYFVAIPFWRAIADELRRAGGDLRARSAG